MIEKIEKIEFASTKKEVRFRKQELNIPLRINIAKGGVKSQVFGLLRKSCQPLKMCDLFATKFTFSIFAQT